MSGGLRGLSRNHISVAWHAGAQGQNPKKMCRAPSGSRSGHHPSWSPRHLPALGHKLFTETSQSESGGTGRGMGRLQNQFSLSKEQGRVKASTGPPAQQPEKGTIGADGRQSRPGRSLTNPSLWENSPGKAASPRGLWEAPATSEEGWPGPAPASPGPAAAWWLHVVPELGRGAPQRQRLPRHC